MHTTVLDRDIPVAADDHVVFVDAGGAKHPGVPEHLLPMSPGLGNLETRAYPMRVDFFMLSIVPKLVRVG